MAVNIAVPDDYKYVLWSVWALIAQYLLVGGIVVMGARKKAFTREFLKQFDDDHKKPFGGQVAKGGYPDNGNGHYGQKLPYNQWVNLANAQRTHYNFLENLLPCVFFLLIGGLGYPQYSAMLGFAAFVGRILYTAGYMIKGGGGRLVGAIVAEIGLIGSFILSGMTIYYNF